MTQADTAALMGDIPSLDLPEIEAPEVPLSDNGTGDIFSARKAWHTDRAETPRCDFAPGHWRLRPKKPLFIHTLWQRSPLGRPLDSIKADRDTMPRFIAENMASYITGTLGRALDRGGWCITTPPPRRHKENNFAQTVAALIARQLRIPFHPDVFHAINRQRVNATFNIGKIPDEPNIIIFDDILTTGSTMQACARAIAAHNKNTIYFTAIDNE